MRCATMRAARTARLRSSAGTPSTSTVPEIVAVKSSLGDAQTFSYSETAWYADATSW